MRRVLFVDDESNVLSGLRRMMRSVCKDWEAEFATNGADALEILDQRPFDALVSDMRMPGMTGAQLLSQAMQRHPKVVRILLSGQCDQESLIRSVGPTHQFLSKPCDADTLVSTIARACTLRDLLTSPSLQRLVSQMASLPSPPALYSEITSAIHSSDASTRRVGELIAKDVGMTAKVLQLVNSAFFGLPRRVSNPVQALSLIGLDTVRAVVLSCHVLTQFDHSAKSGLPLDSLWSHCLAVAGFAKRIAEYEGQDTRIKDDAFTAGMLHDSGKLILAANLPDLYRKSLTTAREENVPLHEAEYAIFGATHAEVGACLMGLWGLPFPVVEALAYHHIPNVRPGKDFCALTAVHAADVLEHEQNPGAIIGIPPKINIEHLTDLGLQDKLDDWRNACRQTAEKNANNAHAFAA